MLIFDGDYPMAYGGIDLNRDLTLPLSEVRAQDETPDNVAFASLPELRQAGVAAALMKFAVRRLTAAASYRDIGEPKRALLRPRGRWHTTTLLRRVERAWC